MSAADRIQTGFLRLGVFLAVPSALLGGLALGAGLIILAIAAYTPLPNEPGQRHAIVEGPFLGSFIISAPRSATQEQVINFAAGSFAGGKDWKIVERFTIEELGPGYQFHQQRYTEVASPESEAYEQKMRQIARQRSTSNDLISGGATGVGFAVVWYYFCAALGWVLAGFFV